MTDLERFFEPEGWTLDKFTNTRGKQIRFGHLDPVGETKGTVIITTGYADFFDSYYETMREYAGRGYDVWVMDWVGQGGSDRQISPHERAQRLEDHVRDLHQFRQQIVSFDKSKPIFMSTHSMGGQIGLHYLHTHPKDFDFAVLAAPFVDFDYNPLTRCVLKAAFRAAVYLGYDNAAIPKDLERLAGNLNNGYKKKVRHQDPVRMDLHKTFMLLNSKLRAEPRTFGMMDSFFDSTAQVREKSFLSSIQTPVLIGTAEREELINNATLEWACTVLPQAKQVLIKDALHGLWTEREPVRQAWWREIDTFLTEQTQKLGTILKQDRFDTANDNDPSLTTGVSKAPLKPKGP